jgi:hypothetical protein
LNIKGSQQTLEDTKMLGVGEGRREARTGELLKSRKE